MVKYRLPDKCQCWSCLRDSEPEGNVNDMLIEWTCQHCGNRNYVFVDHVHFRIGSRMYLAARRLIDQGEHDLASVLLITAIDATLGDGYVTLTNWRAIEQLEPPPDPATIAQSLEHMDMSEKLREFERLAKATMDEEITRLRSEDRISAGEDLSFSTIYAGYDAIRVERNHLVHLGASVNPRILEGNHRMILAAILVLESMWQAAFDVRRTSPAPGETD